MIYMTAKRGLSMLLVILLSACGGSYESGELQKSIRIDVYGDSTAHGTTNVDGYWVQSPSNYPAVLQTLFDAEFGLGQVAVRNKAVPGSTSISGEWIVQMYRSDAHVIVLNFGINDSQTVDIGTYRIAMDRMVRAAKGAGKAVIVETPNPVGAAECAALPDYAQVAREVAKENSVTLIDQYAYLSTIDWRSLMSDDAHVHPTGDGYKVKAQYAYTTLKPIADEELKKPEQPSGMGMPTAS